CRSMAGDIDLRQAETIGDSAFEGCEKNKTAVLPPVNDTAKLGKALFKDCTGLETVTFPAELTFIPDAAFAGCTGITSLILGQGIETVGESAFEGANGFDTVLIYKKVSAIKKNAFAQTKVTKVNYAGSEAEWNTLITNIEAGNDVLLSAEKEFNYVYKTKPMDLKISPLSKTAHVGDEIQLTAVFTPSEEEVYKDYRAVTWSSSDPKVAEVNSSGLVTAKDLGDATITVTTSSPKLSKSFPVRQRLPW
ncbi:MAG: leucine-rich repeat protein, partial [Lachnospiraceae bacterium]|nr:leucine-rich repeat protein [Lachnospiraceae bacterium]